MSPEGFEALRHVVTLARGEQITRAAVLRVRLEDLGHDAQAVSEALIYWANREAGAEAHHEKRSTSRQFV
jgi:hypothetical protein